MITHIYDRICEWAEESDEHCSSCDNVYTVGAAYKNKGQMHHAARTRARCMHCGTQNLAVVIANEPILLSRLNRDLYIL